MEGRSALGNPRLAQLKRKLSMLSDVTFAVFHFPVAGFVSEYPTEAPRINASAETAPSLAPIRRRQALCPISGCQAGSLAFILIHRFSSCSRLADGGELAAYALSGMLHSLSGFPVQISRGMIGCDCYRVISFSYYLLKVGFQLHRG